MTPTADVLASPAVAIVGARACSAYGRTVARSLATRARRGAGSSSSAGWRAGSTARRTAARSRPAGRRSPCSAAASTATTRRRTRELARAIASGGLVVSEYEAGVEPAPWRFPARNRIIAGLCPATVVVEARERSRRADHGRFRARGRAGGARRPGRDHVVALARHERFAAARGDARDVRGGRARGARARRRGGAAPRCRTIPSRSACSRALAAEPGAADELVPLDGARRGRASLRRCALLELAGVVRGDEGMVRQYDRAVTPYWLDEAGAAVARRGRRRARDVGDRRRAA